MKKEIISFVIGAGIVGCAWTATTIIDCKQANSLTAISTTMPTAKVQYPNSLKKVLPDVYSAIPDKNFPGLKLYNTDFLIPWNRAEIIEYEDPEFHQPVSTGAFILKIREKGKQHYFLTDNKEIGNRSQLIYLGENIRIEKFEPVSNGYMMVTYKDAKGKIGRGVVSISNILGEEPSDDTGIAQDITLDPLRKYSDNPDPSFSDMTAEQLWKLYQESLRKNDRTTISKIIIYPIRFNGEFIYTRAEFLRRFDEMFFPEYKEFVLKNRDTIWYSWRGACMPDNCSWCYGAEEKDSRAGAIFLNPDAWLSFYKVK